MPSRSNRIGLSLLLIFVCSCSLHRELDRLSMAEQALQQERKQDAIDYYNQHIAERLAVTNRPAWENPYFYELLIGDIELSRENPEAALQAYEKAQTEKVTEGLVLDRIRLVASWHEKRGEYEKATETLLRYRSRDPLLFDLMLDRISRELTKREDLAKTAKQFK